jgi:hypothetical protein
MVRRRAKSLRLVANLYRSHSTAITNLFAPRAASAYTLHCKAAGIPEERVVSLGCTTACMATPGVRKIRALLRMKRSQLPFTLQYKAQHAYGNECEFGYWNS